MIAVRKADEEILIKHICSENGIKWDTDTGAYMVFDGAKFGGSCVYVLKDGEGSVVFADEKITSDPEIADLVLRTVTDFMMRNKAARMTVEPPFPETVLKAVGFSRENGKVCLELEGFTLSHCCGKTE